MTVPGLIPRAPEQPAGDFPLRVRRALQQITDLLNSLIIQGVVVQVPGPPGGGSVWKISGTGNNTPSGTWMMADGDGEEGPMGPPGQQGATGVMGATGPAGSGGGSPGSAGEDGEEGAVGQPGVGGDSRTFAFFIG